jgi:hypothetical protein
VSLEEGEPMGKSKISDQQLTERLMDSPNKTYYEIAKSFGLVPQSSFNARCRKIEHKLGMPERDPGKPGRNFGSKDGTKRQEKPKAPAPRPIIEVEPFMGIAKPEPKPIISPDDFFNVKLEPDKEKPKTVIGSEPTQAKPLFFRPNEQVYYEDRLCTVIMSTAEKMVLRRNADMHHITITAERYTENPGILRQIDEKPPLPTVGEDVIKRRTVREIAETAKRFEPINLNGTTGDEEPGKYEAEEIDRLNCFDFEMDDNADAVKDFGPLFEETDYIDPEWGAKPTFWQRAKNAVARIVGR